jgi:hypothetical protein
MQTGQSLTKQVAVHKLVLTSLFNCLKKCDIHCTLIEFLFINAQSPAGGHLLIFNNVFYIQLNKQLIYEQLYIGQPRPRLNAKARAAAHAQYKTELL